MHQYTNVIITHVFEMIYFCSIICQWSGCLLRSVFQRKRASDAAVEIASRVKGLFSDRGRGPSLVLTRPGNAEREQDGGMDGGGGGGGMGTARAPSDSHTHVSSILWCPSYPDPSSFWIFEPTLAASYTVKWGFSDSLPHHHIHTQPQILSHTRSTLLHIAADCKNTLCCVVESWA